MQSMLQRMKSSITQKMMGIVEQERALMLEQQQLETVPSRRQNDALGKINIDESETAMKDAEEAKAGGRLSGS